MQSLCQNPQHNNIPEPCRSNYHTVQGHDEVDEDGVDPLAASVYQDPQQGECARCVNPGRKPAGRKGRPKPTTYIEVEEAVIFEGVLRVRRMPTLVQSSAAQVRRWNTTLGVHHEGGRNPVKWLRAEV